jgi:hypothetical protein
MKCAGSSLEATIMGELTSDALCTGGQVGPKNSKKEYPHQNNEYFDNTGYIVRRFHAHTWPDLFFERIKSKDLYQSYQHVTINRNPWDQLVSFFYYSAEWVFHTYKPSPGDSRQIINLKFKKWAERIGSYPTYIHRDEETLTSPIKWLANHTEKFSSNLIDNNLAFENLQEDYDALCRRLNLPSKRLKNLKTKNRLKKNHYSYYYNTELKNQVYDLFPSTIKKFNYTFEEKHKVL